MNRATRTDIEDARLAALDKNGGFDSFYSFRDWLDKRFPNCIFSLSQEEDVWFSIPKELKCRRKDRVNPVHSATMPKK